MAFVKITTASGISYANNPTIKASAVMTEVNRIMSDYSGEIPKEFRSTLTSLLYEAIREGGLRMYQGVAKSGPNKGISRKRLLLAAGTPLTPFTARSAQGDGRRDIKDRAVNAGGVNAHYWMEKIVNLYLEGKLNPITGISVEQLEVVTRSSFRNYRINSDQDTITELV